MYAYLRSQERDDNPQSYSTTGMLLHPSIDSEGDNPITEHTTIQGHQFMFCSVNLGLHYFYAKYKVLFISVSVRDLQERLWCVP